MTTETTEELRVRLEGLLAKINEPEPTDLVAVDSAQRPRGSHNALAWSNYYDRIASARKEACDLLPKLLAALSPPPAAGRDEPFQARVEPWLVACFGIEIAADREERNHRFLEEALELVQSCGCTASEAHQLVDYVYGRDIGEPAQEVGGVMVTLAALCLANDLDMHSAGETELARIWTKVEAIRAKQVAKPKHSPLPIALKPPHCVGGVEGLMIPLLDPVHAEDHPVLAPIINKRVRAAANFSPEFSGQRGEDFDRGLMCAFEAVNGQLQRMTSALKGTDK